MHLESIEIYYDPRINRFIDEGGFVIHNIYEILLPWQIEWAKEASKEEPYICLESPKGHIVEIFFPCEYEEFVY